jgi:CheY-like chemotaxis protein
MPDPVRKALVVDDNRDNAESLARLLRTFGYSAEFTFEPLSALTVVDRFRPSIVFLDIGMPDLDGYQLAQHIRARYGKEAVRLVALTGYATSADRVRGRVAGFDAYLLKPATPELVESTITTLFAPLPPKIR